MSTIRVVSGIVVLPAPILALAALAAFRADVTPPQGEPLIWVTPAARVEDPLWAKGIVLDDGKGRYVLCAMDWCGVGSSICGQFRDS